jgi:transcriptional regulator with XRE-family HTH domain
MDAMSPWPALIKRLRFLTSLKQCELAQQLGVDQGTVSRWERGVHVPDIGLQRELRDRLRTLHPAISLQYIEQLPSLTGVNYLGFERIRAWSGVAAGLYDLTCEQMREANPECILADDCLEMGQALRDNPAWMNGHAVSYKAIVERAQDDFVQICGTPINGTGFFLWNGVRIDRPPGFILGHCHIEFQTYDELCA